MSAIRETDATARLEDLAFLAAHGVGATEAARRTGTPTVDALEVFLRRHGRGDLWALLRAHDPIPLHWPPTKQHPATRTTDRRTA